ncbi:hypothetical protein BpHYR1_001089 [Brachionus plicatilis]|uniref:DUF2237 domain-containing protein n=1 Tax=Brachionus plicatilis TaxID=10195 RepID=A0A3M7RI72_BRAPC|nr:hypothetical protein BpHYR1_001089 [Brachionus plicatilis]
MNKESRQFQFNVYDERLDVCSESPMTGFTRNGKCETSAIDLGTHLICATVTEKFLEYTKSVGNDLSTPRPMYQFPGLKPGDNWCLCVNRWVEAQKAGVAPPVVLRATNKKVLNYLEKFRMGLDNLK